MKEGEHKITGEVKTSEGVYRISSNLTFQYVRPLTKKEKWEALGYKIMQSLKDKPIPKGFEVKELSEDIEVPQPRSRCHLELLEERLY